MADTQRALTHERLTHDGRRAAQRVLPTGMRNTMATVEARLAELGLELPSPFPAAGDYVPCRRSGSLLYVSGHGPMRDGRAVYTGKLGAGVDLETGQQAAELTMLNVLASVATEVGSLDQISGFLRILVYVNSTPEFTQHPAVADGASRLLRRLYGPAAAHARCAVGMISLPMDITTEIEAVIELA